MKLSLLIFSLLIFVGNNVIGKGKQDDLPELTLCKPPCDKPISEEEFDSLNKLRTDIWKSLNDLQSRMPTKRGKGDVQVLKNEIMSFSKEGNSVLSEKSDVAQVVGNLNDIIYEFIPHKLPRYVFGIMTGTEQLPWLEYIVTILPEFQGRLEPFRKYEDYD